MHPRIQRTLLRIFHIALGAVIAALVYMPPTWTEPIRLVLGVVVVPLLVASGLVLWHQGRITRWLARRRTSERRSTVHHR